MDRTTIANANLQLWEQSIPILIADPLGRMAMARRYLGRVIPHERGDTLAVAVAERLPGHSRGRRQVGRAERLMGEAGMSSSVHVIRCYLGGEYPDDDPDTRRLLLKAEWRFGNSRTLTHRRALEAIRSGASEILVG